MEQILRGIVASNHPENVKKSLIQQLVSKAGGNVADDQNRTMFEIGTEWMTDEKAQFLNESGKLLLTTWVKRQKDVFQKFFTEEFLLSFLTERDQMSSSCVEYLRTSFDLMQHSSQIFSLYTIVRHRAHIWVEKNSNTDFCAAVARLLIEYDHCWPVGENLLQFNLSLIKALSKTELPKTSKEEMKACIQNGGVIGALLNKMWVKNQALLFPVLTEIFKIISMVGPSPSVALASVVQYFSTDIIDTATNLAASNPSVSDQSLSLSLGRMINWLSWPGAKKVDQWIIGFLKALASAQKHSILVSVTLKEVAQVFSRLLFPVVRESTMVVLSHMLLSFQHSPEAFHEIVEHVPGLVQNLKKENTLSSQSTLQTLAELMHCLMYQHTGFPELYGPVLDCLQDLPKPSEVMIRKWLAQSTWSARTVSIPQTGFTPKSETGKTGLVNLGNTCYMNSVLQALYMLEEFRYMTFGCHTPSGQPVLHNLQEVFAFLALSQRSAFAPSKFLQVARPPWFSPGTQQDCSEFLKFLLDRVSEEDKSLNDSNDNDSQRTSLVDDTFAGKLLVCLCCRRCNNSSCREEVFTDLPLAFPQAGELEDRVDAMGNDDHTSTKQPVEHVDVTSAGSSTVSSERSLKGGDISHITSPSDLATKTAEENEAMATSTSHGPASGESSRSFSTNLPTKFHDSGVRVNAPNVSISELLEYFFEPEILQGSNQYHCEQCHSLQDAERTVTISKPSNFLVLTLKRFAYNVRTQQRSKILQSVTYPLTLKLPSVHLERSVPTRDAVFRDIQEGPPEVFEEKSEDLINESCFRSKRTKQEHDSVVNSASNEGVIDTCDEKPTSDIVYSLCSVIVHSGTSSESGHYYCYARSSAQVTEEEDVDDSASSRTTDQDTWFLFNDSRVSYSAFSTFADVSKRFPKDTPYVLIYKRVSPCGTIIPVESSREIRQDLADLVNRDNLLYLQEQERQVINAAKRKAWSHSYQPPDDDDDNNRGPPGSCGSGPGFTTPFNRFVF